MRVVVVGLGIQGRKRLAVAGTDVVATVDPVIADARYRRLEDVPVGNYDAALLCVPDAPKLQLLAYLAGHGKHALVEKPVLATDRGEIGRISRLANERQVVFYTAYNHRFEPHFIHIKRLLESGELGRLYRCRMFYGNGTALDVRNSPWRDQGAGVLPDLGSHLLDTVLFWFGPQERDWRVISCDSFENAAFDHVVIGANGVPSIELEMTLLSWRNHFTCDIFAKHGSAHIGSLCKWGPSVFTHRRRKLPSGRPDEETVTLVQADPTWDAEYVHFKELCYSAAGGNLENDIWINDRLSEVSKAALVRGST